MFRENNPTINQAISLLSKAVADNKFDLFKNAADSILNVCENQYVSKRFESVFLLYSALCYEISGELVRSRIPYNLLDHSTILPLGESIIPRNVLTDFNELLFRFGSRDIPTVVTLGETIFSKIQGLQHIYENSDDYDDEVILLLGIMELVLSYSECIKDLDTTKLGELSSVLEKFKIELNNNDSDPWLMLLAKLVSRAIEMATKRSILNLPIQDSIKKELVNQKIVEVWEPQKLAIDNGILSNQNLLMSMSTASGKSLLSTLVTYNSSQDNKTIFIAPTRTLVNELFGKISNMLKNTPMKVAISTRESTNFDSTLSDQSVIVSTFEKFSSLLRKQTIQEKEIKTLVVDEAHVISHKERGIPLEFLISNLKDSKQRKPQIVALSGMINDNDAKSLSTWINGKNVRSSWRPVDLDETVFCNGKLYTKDGTMPEIRAAAPRTLANEERRVLLAMKISQIEMTKNNQSMIIFHSRSMVEKVSLRIHNEIKNLQSLFSRVEDEEDNIRKSYGNKIRMVEPELPSYAVALANMIEVGVAYHHAGLPAIYRNIIEDAVRRQAVKILVTTSTMEAGVNLPVSTVIFPNPLVRIGPYESMTVNQYKNLAGRAGRPGYDRRGKSILIALDELEKEKILEKFIRSEADQVTSGLKYFISQFPESRYAVHSEILNILAKKGPLSKNQIAEYARNTWFLKNASPDEITKFFKQFDLEIWKLQTYGCVSESRGRCSIEKLGYLSTNSMLYAFSIVNIVGNLQRIISSGLTSEQFDILFLSLVGLAYELKTYDEFIKNVRVSPEVSFVSQVIQYDKKLYEKFNRVELAPKFGTILWYWINSTPTPDIIKKCEIELSDSASIEEGLKEDAFWVLSTIGRISDQFSGLTASHKKRVLELAEFCKIGSSDPMVKNLLELGCPGMKRGTAIKLSNYIKKNGVTLKQITKEQFLSIFPDNKESARKLYNEIQSLEGVSNV